MLLSSCVAVVTAAIGKIVFAVVVTGLLSLLGLVFLLFLPKLLLPLLPLPFLVFACTVGAAINKLSLSY